MHLGLSSKLLTGDRLVDPPHQRNQIFSLEVSLEGSHFGVQRLLKLLLLLQVPENLPTDALQALHLPFALVHLPLQGFDSQRQLWEFGRRDREEKGRRW